MASKTKKETNLDGEVQASKNGTVYFTTTKDTVHGVARVANFMKPLHLALMHSRSTITTVYEVVKVRLKWYEIVRVEKQCLLSVSGGKCETFE